MGLLHFASSTGGSHDAIPGRRFVAWLLLIAFVCGCSRSANIGTSRNQETFGHRQLAQMLDDRSDMKGVLHEDHPVVMWMVQGFNGERLGQRVYWNANSPYSGRSSECAPSYVNYPAHIALSGGTETTPIDKWASAVYEMHNLEQTDRWNAIRERATKGRLTADEFAKESVAVEFTALENTKTFFTKNPLPDSMHGRDSFYKWVMTDIGTIDEYQKEQQSHGNYEYFKKEFEESIMPYAEYMRDKDEVDSEADQGPDQSL